MKQIYTEQNSNAKGIIDATSVKNNLISKSLPVGIYSLNCHLSRRLLSLSKQVSGGGSNIFLNQNFGKAPPGQSRSPGVGIGLFPDHPPDGEADQDASPLFFGREGPGVSQKRIRLINTKQTFYNTQKLNFYSQLIFTNMKKQILFLAVFILTAIVSINSSYGQQLVPGKTTPQATTCVGEPLHPYPGVPYNYSVTIGNGVTVPADGYTWWATKDQNFITASGTINYGVANRLNVEPGELIFTGPGYGTTSGTATMTITWSPEVLAGTDYQGLPGPGTPTFVAVVGTSTCTNNIQVYEINPKPNFTVDITNIDPSTLTSTTYSATVAQCVDVVRSAVYNTTSKEIDMDYGTNTLYFEVVAANFVTSWKPLFQIMTGSLVNSQRADISWYESFSDAQSGTGAIESFNGLADGATASATTALVADATVANTVNGVSLFVKVVIHNYKEESLAVRPFTLAVDGVDFTNEWDLVNTTCTEPNAADQLDLAVHNINPRPDIDDATIDTQTDPDTFIEKTNP